MSLDCRENGHRQTLIQRWKKALASTAFAAAVGTGLFLNLNAPAHSGGETRTVSLYHVHTGESLTVTYMKDGKYIPSAMKKINYLMRDWRRNEIITISPRTVDLMWELHEDLGSKRPINIVCGYRSPKTNAFLKKIGRNVARKSQHMLGKAIDLYFPDVPTEKMRNSALVRQAGGVGYYRSGGGPTGFLHVDSGNVRYWGPSIGATQMARIMRDYRKTVGARLGKGGRGSLAVPEVEVAQADATASGLPSQQDGPDKNARARNKPPVESAYTEDDEELAGMSADASAPAPRPKLKTTEDPQQPEQVAEAPDGITKGYPVPRPRPKPIEVLMMAAVNMKIEPASAPPPDQMAKPRVSPVEGNSIGVVVAAETMAETETVASGKTSLTDELRSGEAQGVPTIKSITASASGDDLFWWPQQLVFDPSKAVRRDGAPQQFGETTLAGLLPGIEEAQADPAPQLPRLAVADVAQVTASGKGDMQVVNREGKGSLLTGPTLKKMRLGMADGN